jgi:hypothetical protein
VGVKSSQHAHGTPRRQGGWGTAHLAVLPLALKHNQLLPLLPACPAPGTTGEPLE